MAQTVVNVPGQNGDGAPASGFRNRTSQSAVFAPQPKLAFYLSLQGLVRSEEYIIWRKKQLRVEKHQHHMITVKELSSQHISDALPKAVYSCLWVSMSPVRGR